MSTATDIVTQMKAAMSVSKSKRLLSQEVAFELQAAGLTRDWEEFSTANSKSPTVLNILQDIATVDAQRITPKLDTPIDATLDGERNA